jgi:hypothetical protein
VPGMRGNRRFLHSATRIFLLRLVALVNLMRLSLLKAAHVVMSFAAWQEIRVRSSRDLRFLCSGSLVKLRFATNTAAFAYASFAQDQQIKSNFNQANSYLTKLFLSGHSMRARWHYPVSQITVS